MMDGMAVLPLAVRDKRQYARNGADNIIGFAVFEERAMAAVMENNKGADHKSRSRDREQKRKPVGYLQTEISSHP
ncbi:hypothetical protein D3C87_2027970 [compost metagenome]